MTTNARRGLAVLSALVLALASALWLVGVGAAQATGNEVHKSYVCKYVDKPGEAEVLQTGDNPIWVDNHSLLGHDGTTVVGQEFSDAQGRSVVIVANTPKLDPEPGIDQCPAPNPSPSPTPTVTSPTPTPPTAVQFSFDDVVTPPTCEAAGALLIDAFPGVSITVDPEFDGPGTYTLTATLDDPVTTTFSDGTTEPKTKVVTVNGALGFQSTDPEAPCFLASTDTPTPTPTTTTPTPTPTVTTPTPTPTGTTPVPTPTGTTPVPTHHTTTTPAQPTHLAKTGTPSTTWLLAGLLTVAGGIGLLVASRTPKTARRH